jgi:hypothetical protein
MSPFSNLFGLRQDRKNRRSRRTKRLPKSHLHIERLEDRRMLANVTTLQFNIPPETADLGVQAGLYSNTNNIYLDPSSKEFETLSGVPTKLPLFTLAQPASQTRPHDAPVQYDLHIPGDTDVKSGELFLFVGEVHQGLAVSGGKVAAPKATPDPSTVAASDNFAQFEFNYQTDGAGAGLDIDISAVDSTGYPFTLVYPSSANLPFPLNPLGITLDQKDLNTNFRAAFAAGGQYSRYPEFAQCATFTAQQDPQNLQVVAPQDILSVESAPPILTSAVASTQQTGQLSPDASHWYRITAFSDKIIANSDGVRGETLLSNAIKAPDLAPNNSVALTWNRYYDPNTAGYNVYRYSTTDPAAPTDATSYNLIAQVYGAMTTTYIDQGAVPQAQQISVETENNYGFNPLSEYYTQEIRDFFTHYAAPNSFSMRSNGALWVGNTVSYTPEANWNTSDATYTVLQLTAQNSVPGATIQEGDIVNVYQPIFSSNTRYVLSDAPPMPSWMAAATDPHESPSQMVFGCDAAFASDKHDPDIMSNADLAAALGAIENSIVSALNRGIATDYSIPPDNWASFPQILDFPTVREDAQSQVTETTQYFYAVTAVNVYGETTPSLVVTAKLEAGEVATLHWSNGENAAPAKAYHVYRGTSLNDLALLHTTTDSHSTSYTDIGTPATGPSLLKQYFASGTTSNWYAAVVQTNSLLDPKAGVSINGLSYGFPYSDQGGTSTNILFPPDEIPAIITVNLGSPESPGFVTQSLPDAVASRPYRQTFMASGNGIGTKFAISQGQLPGWLNLNGDTGVLSGVAPNVPTAAPHEFIVQITDNVSSTSMPFRLSVIGQAPAQPLRVAGLSGTNLTLNAADQDLPYTTRIEVAGGTGPYTLRMSPSQTLPTGLALGSLGSEVLTSPTGTFTLSGTQTQIYDSPNVGFEVVASDSTVTTASVTLGISEATVEINGAGMNYLVGDRFRVAGSGSAAVIEVATVDGNGGIQSLSVVDPGSGFTNAPDSIEAISVNGTGAAFGARGDRFRIVEILVTNPGRGYAAAPVVTISGGGAGQQTTSATLGTGTQLGRVVEIAIPTDVYYTPAAGMPQVFIDPPSSDAQKHVTIQMTVNPSLGIETTSLPQAFAGQPYFQQIKTNQRTAGVEFAVTDGQLPNGLTLEPWGVLHGTPTRAASFSFEITANSAAGGIASQRYASFEVTDTTMTPLAITTTQLPPGAPGASYSHWISASGGSSGGVSFTLVNGQLPDGLTLTNGGEIQGTPTAGAAGIAAFTVRAKDRVGNTAFQGYEIGVLEITRSTASLAANATQLIIKGAGFDTTRTHNLVSLPGSGATNIEVTEATPTSLTVRFSGPLNSGPLQATVAVQGTPTDPQQVAHVVAASTPVISPSTEKLATNANKLIISGTGFDTSDNGSNVVSLSSGTIELVEVVSATQLTVTLRDAPDLGPLHATVTTDGVRSSSEQVADVVAAAIPSINANQRNIFQNETKLVISGTGFDSSASGTTTVQLKLDGVSVSFGSVTVKSSHEIEIRDVTFSSADQSRSLTATVNVNGVASRETHIGHVVPNSQLTLSLPPTVPNLAPNATQITLYGTGFTNESSVELSRNYGKGWESISGFTTTVNSPNQITITGLDLPTPTNAEGTVAAAISDPTNGSSGDLAAVGRVSLAPQTAPRLVTSNANMSNTSTTLTINGTGFDPNGTNVVALFSAGVTLHVTAIALSEDGAGQDVAVNAEGTQLTVKLAGDLPTGQLDALVTTNGVRSAGPVQVKRVVGPTIAPAATKLSLGQTALILKGFGFDPHGVNEVMLYSGQSKIVQPADAVESVVADSDNQLTVILNARIPLAAGELFAVAQINGVSSGPAVQVAELIEAGPMLEYDARHLESDAQSLLIAGARFASTSGANAVTLSTVAGPINDAITTVAVDSSSQLTLTLKPGALPTGQLYAMIETANAKSSVVQVANVIPAPASVTHSMIRASQGSIHVGESVCVTLQAKDSLGRDVTDGDLGVGITLAPGSAGGVFGATINHGNGIYTTTFTGSRVGENAFNATLNGQLTTCTASIRVWHYPIVPILVPPVVAGSSAFGNSPQDYDVHRSVESRREGHAIAGTRPDPATVGFNSVPRRGFYSQWAGRRADFGTTNHGELLSLSGDSDELELGETKPRDGDNAESLDRLREASEAGDSEETEQKPSDGSEEESQDDRGDESLGATEFVNSEQPNENGSDHAEDASSQ